MDREGALQALGRALALGAGEDVHELVEQALALEPSLARGLAHAQRMLTARETIRPIVTSETSDCRPITPLAFGVSGIVSVGENAVAFVSDTYR